MNSPDFATSPACLGWSAHNRHTVACMHQFLYILRWPPVPVVWFMSESRAVAMEHARISPIDLFQQFWNGSHRERVITCVFRTDIFLWIDRTPFSTFIAVFTARPIFETKNLYSEEIKTLQGAWPYVTAFPISLILAVDRVRHIYWTGFSRNGSVTMTKREVPKCC